MLTTVWHSYDPRDLDRCREIVIYCTHTRCVFTGTVETEHGYNVFLSGREVDERSIVTADDAWPEHWHWVYAP